MESEVLSCIKKHSLFSENDTVCVALSGGCDSMVLLNVLVNLGYKVKACHFEHGIRGEKSLEDAEFVKNYCEKRGIPFECGSADVPMYAGQKGISTETAARILRYEYFSSVRCDCIATAHHADDQTETILQHIVRGSGIKGLCGMLPKNGRIVRPLLGITRDEIEAYAACNNIPYVKDDTNDDTAYTRNYIRKHIIPGLKELNPQLSSAFARLSESAGQAMDVIGKQADGIPVEVRKDGVYADFDILRNAPRIVSQYVIYRMFCLAGQEVDIESTHISEILALERPGAKKLIKNGFYAKNEYGKLIISDKTNTIEMYSVPFENGAEFPGGRLDIVQSAFDSGNTDRNCESFSHIPETAVIRNRRKGDIFRPFGGKEKTLSDFMTDAKIPPDERDSVPLLADGNRIIWVVGRKISADYAVNGSKYITLKFSGENANG